MSASAAERSLERRAEAEWLDRCPALPTAEELAAPFLGGFFKVFDLMQGDARTEALCSVIEGAEFDDSIDVEPYRRQLAELVDLIERTAQLVRVGLAGLLPGGDERSAEVCALDHVLRTLAQTGQAERTLVGSVADRLLTVEGAR